MPPLDNNFWDFWLIFNSLHAVGRFLTPCVEKGEKLKKRSHRYKNKGTGEYDIDSLSSYGAVGPTEEGEEELVGGFGEGGEDLDEDQLEDLEEKQLLGRIGSLETSKYEKTS